MAIPFNKQITVDYADLQAQLESATSPQTAKETVGKLEADTEAMLKLIGASDTGKALYAVMAATGKKMRITHAKRSNDAGAKAASWKDATPKGKKALDPTPGDRHDPTGGVKGTGRGSDTEIEYTPSIWAASVSTCTTGQVCGAGYSRDEVLFHEMFHGMRVMAGQFLATPMGDKFTTEEEFIAILVTNIFSAETGREMRANHQDVADLKDPARYVRKHATRIATFKRQQQQFADALGKVVPKKGFNPLAKKGK